MNKAVWEDCGHVPRGVLRVLQHVKVERGRLGDYNCSWKVDPVLCRGCLPDPWSCEPSLVFAQTPEFCKVRLKAPLPKGCALTLEKCFLVVELPALSEGDLSQLWLLIITHPH